MWQLDLADFASVKAFVQKALELERLDVLIHNAGISSSEWHLSKDGWEQSCVSIVLARDQLIFDDRLQVNVIAPTYISTKLLPLMQTSFKLEAPSSFKPHMVFISSDAHHRAQFGKSTLLLMNCADLETQKNQRRLNPYKPSTTHPNSSTGIGIPSASCSPSTSFGNWPSSPLIKSFSASRIQAWLGPT